MVGHFQNAADVRGLALVQEQVSAGRIAINPVAALEEAKCHQRVQKILGRTRVKSQPVPQSLAALRLPRELREQLHLHCAQERLRGPEAKAELHDLIWCRIVTHVPASSAIEQARSRQGALSSQRGARETWPVRASSPRASLLALSSRPDGA